MSGNTLRLLAAGTVTIIASQAGNEEYQAVSVSRRLAISVALTETVEARGTWRFSSQGDGSPANRASRPAYGALRWEPPTTVGQDVALQCGAGDASGTENTAMVPSVATRPRHRFYAIMNADGTYTFGQPVSGERILRISGLGADNSADPNNYVDIVTGTDKNPAPNNFASTNKGNTDSVGAEGGYGNADLNTQTVHVWGRVKALQGSFAVNSDLLLQRILIT